MFYCFVNGFGLLLEGKWKSGSDKDKLFYEGVSNGIEVVVSYVYKIDKIFFIESGFLLDLSLMVNSYCFYLCGKVNIIDDFFVLLCYCFYYKCISVNINIKKDMFENGYNLMSVLSYKINKDF